MQTPEMIAEQIRDRKKLLMIHLTTKKELNELTDTEKSVLKQLLMEQVNELEQAVEQDNSFHDSFSHEDQFEQDPGIEYDDIGIQAENSIIIEDPKVPTIAAEVAKLIKPRVVKIKKDINTAHPDDKLGSQRTPVKEQSKDTSGRFFLSPGGTTATYEQTTTVKVKKTSGRPFVAEDDDALVQYYQ